MLKKCVSITLAAIMLLMPMTASAVTWGQVLDGLNRGNGVYNKEGTSAEIKDGSLTVQGGTVEDVDVTWVKNGSGSMTPGSIIFNNVTLAGEIARFVANGSDFSVTLKGSTQVRADEVEISAENGGELTVNNEGRILHEVFVLANGENSQVTFNNDKTIEDDVFVHSSDGGSATLNNDKTIKGSVIASAYQEGSSTEVNNGKAIEGDVYLYGDDDGSTVMSNDGAIKGDADVYAWGGDASLVNDGSIGGEASVGAGGGGKASLDNSGSIAKDVSVDGSTDSKISLENSGKLGGALGVSAVSNSEVSISNSSSLKNGVTLIAKEDAQIDLKNRGSISNKNDIPLVADLYDQASISVTGSGVVKPGQYVETDGTIHTITEPFVFLNLPKGTDMSDPNAVKAAAAELAQNISIDDRQVTGGKDSIDGFICYWNEETNDWALYEDMTVTIALNETPDEPAPETPDEEEDDDGPSKEMIRHWMEEKRKEEAVGGVTGSPYVLKQLYLGYHSLDLWLYDSEGQKMFFREYLSAVGDGTKNLTLQLDSGSTEGMTMRLSQNVLRTLRRAEFSTITLLGTDGSLYMQYQVSDLWETFRQYRILPWELLCVGSANDEVLKVLADLTLAPID